MQRFFRVLAPSLPPLSPLSPPPPSRCSWWSGPSVLETENYTGKLITLEASYPSNLGPGGKSLGWLGLGAPEKLIFQPPSPPDTP
jgi:hypothetical protein